MNLFYKILISSVLVLLISQFLPGVEVQDFATSIWVAIVLGLLHVFVKPIFVLLTLPVTIITLGLFLLIINAVIIVLCTMIVKGFAVHSYYTAFVFSIVLSVMQSIIFKLVKPKLTKK